MRTRDIFYFLDITSNLKITTKLSDSLFIAYSNNLRLKLRACVCMRCIHQEYRLVEVSSKLLDRVARRANTHRLVPISTWDSIFLDKRATWDADKPRTLSEGAEIFRGDAGPSLARG